MGDPITDLDDGGRRAVEAARRSAAAMGDHRCGTEHLLLGVVATAGGEMAEVAELFVLDPGRVERAVHAVRADRVPGGRANAALPMTRRAQAALSTPRHNGNGPTGPFEILLGALADDASGACAVLRELGVRAEEVRRLAAYGTRHLTREEAALLVDLLDRRRPGIHRPWWGPDPARLPVALPGFEPIELARSSSAVACLEGVWVDAVGFGISMRVRSLRSWVLPPLLEPPELLVPGEPAGAGRRPEVLRLELAFADGCRVSNDERVERFTERPPREPVLVPLCQRSETTSYNDRRRAEERSVSAQWWIWPLPGPGPVEVRVDWPAEVLAGGATFDARPMLRAAASLEARSARR